MQHSLYFTQTDRTDLRAIPRRFFQLIYFVFIKTETRVVDNKIFKNSTIFSGTMEIIIIFFFIYTKNRIESGKTNKFSVAS